MTLPSLQCNIPKASREGEKLATHLATQLVRTVNGEEKV